RLVRRPNFAPAFQFVVGDTGVTVGTSNPAYKLDVAAPINTTTQYNIGGAAFAHVYGIGNTFLGKYAGNFAMSGSDNTRSGWYALSSNTTGFSNTGIGFQALWNNSSGAYNTASGMLALGNNLGGS